MRDSVKLGFIGVALVIVLAFGWCWRQPGAVEKHSEICSYTKLDIDGTRFFIMVTFSVLVSDQRKSIDLNKMAEVVIFSHLVKIDAFALVADQNRSIDLN